MNISYEQIRAFVTVAELGSFSAAAKALGKHRTTLGQVISNLEVETNLCLFDRSGKFPMLTAQGQSLYKHAKNLSEYTRSFEHICQSVEQGIESDITIYHTNLLPLSLIQHVMVIIRHEYKNVNVHWFHRSNSEAHQGIENGDVDIALVLNQDSKAVSQTDYIYAASMPFCLCAAPDSDIFKEENIDLNSMKRHRQLVLEDYVNAGVEEMVIVSNYSQRIESMDVLLTLLSAGDGWALVPRHAVETMIEEKRLSEFTVKEIGTAIRFPVVIWSSYQSKIGPIRQRLIQLLSESLVRLY